MPQTVRRGSITLDAQILAAARLRSDALGLRINLYVAVLIRNDLLHHSVIGGAKITMAAKRAELPLSLPKELRRHGSARAFKLGLNFSRYVEMLIDADLRAPLAPLAIHPYP